MITTVVFDLDDTLYDEVDYCRSGFAAVAGRIAVLPASPPADVVFRCIWDQFSGGNRTTTFDGALAKLGIAGDPLLIEELVVIYRSHKPQIDLPADTGEVLKRLSEKYTLALLTDGFLPAQQLKVQALQIEKYFKCIIYTEKLGRQFWKPSPAAFEKLMSDLRVQPRNAVYVADNEIKDFIAPNRLGWRTIRIIRPATVHTQSGSGAGSPSFIIRKITELPDLLDRL